jgi:hypothetical protein
MSNRILEAILSRLPVIRELQQISENTRRMSIALKELRAIESYRLQQMELPRHPRYADTLRLLRHGYAVCSQNGEDGIVEEIFRRIGCTDRVFAEVGIGDGTENNTGFLLSQGWKGYWIDGDGAFRNKLSGRSDLPPKCIQSAVTYVSKENIASVFEGLGVPKEFDLLSLDIDQNTYHLWEALGTYRPRVVIVEYNASIPAHIDWKVSYSADRMWDGSNNFGASLKAFEGLGRRLGYALVGCEANGVNAFFVRDDLLGDKFAAPYTAENHFEPPRYALPLDKGHRAGILDRNGTE